MRSLMVTTTRQLATVISTGNSRFDKSVPGKCRELDVYAWIVASRDVVVECAREGDGLAKSPRFGTADTDLMQDVIQLRMATVTIG